MTENYNFGRTVWKELSCIYTKTSAAEISPLPKVMVMRDNAPGDFIARLSPQHAERLVGQRDPGTPALSPGSAAGRGRHALPFTCCAAICRRHVRRHHPGGHVGGRAALVSSSTKEDSIKAESSSSGG